MKIKRNLKDYYYYHYEHVGVLHGIRKLDLKIFLECKSRDY